MHYTDDPTITSHSIRYFGEYSVRGANLDSIDLPLVNQNYLTDVLAAAASLPAGSAVQVAAVKNITSFEDPGPGGFYDDLGVAGKQPHLVSPVSWEDDPDYYRNPLSACAIAKDLHWTNRLGAPPLSLPRIPMYECTLFFFKKKRKLKRQICA